MGPKSEPIERIEEAKTASSVKDEETHLLSGASSKFDEENQVKKAPIANDGKQLETVKGDSKWQLAPTLRFDLRLMAQTQERIEEFGALNDKDVDVLLLGGGDSPSYLKESTERLAKLIPRAEHVKIKGLGMMGLRNQNAGGEPELAIPALTKFLVGS
jgi:pimeloyl-ACP methyl ester carboxylesterase